MGWGSLQRIEAKNCRPWIAKGATLFREQRDRVLETRFFALLPHHPIKQTGLDRAPQAPVRGRLGIRRLTNRRRTLAPGGP